jgi:hypothetical protein
MSKLNRLDPETLAHNPRAKLTAWYKYQPTVRAAFEKFPRVYRFTPENMTAATVSSRLRDAIRGCLVFHYPIEFTTHSQLTEWWDTVVVKHTTTDVLIGPPEATVEALKSVDTDAPGYRFNSLTFEELTAFAVLLSSAKLTGPVTVLDPPTDLGLLAERPNLELVSRPDGSLVLL